MPGRLGTTGAESVAVKASRAIPVVCLRRNREEGVNRSGKHECCKAQGARGFEERRSRVLPRQLARTEVDTDTRILSVQVGHVV